MSNELETTINEVKESVAAIYEKLLGTIQEPEKGILVQHARNTKFLMEYGEPIKEILKWYKDRKDIEKTLKMKFWIVLLIASMSVIISIFWDGIKEYFGG